MEQARGSFNLADVHRQECFAKCRNCSTEPLLSTQLLQHIQQKQMKRSTELQDVTLSHCSGPCSPPQLSPSHYLSSPATPASPPLSSPHPSLPSNSPFHEDTRLCLNLRFYKGTCLTFRTVTPERERKNSRTLLHTSSGFAFET